MNAEQVSFLAGKDALGGNIWLPASVEDREQRGDDEWLYLLPAFSDSEDSARWVKASDVRRPTSHHAEVVDSPPPPVRLHVVK